jgi:tetratricopeptide (TPR) repeat protein
LRRALHSLGFLPLLVACTVNQPSVNQRALLLSDTGRREEAAALLEQHLGDHPADIEARRLLVRILAASGQLGRAEEEVAVLFRELGSKSPIPWVERGHALELAHRYDEALAQYDAAAEAAPDDPLGPLTGGLRAAAWGEAEIAEPRLVEALSRDGKNARAWHALGVVRLELGDLQGAKSAYSSGLSADPAALENRIGLATVALAEDDPKEALKQYDAILAARPKFGDAELGRAWALMRLGRLDDAEKALESGYRLGANPRALAKQRALLRELRERGGRER